MDMIGGSKYKSEEKEPADEMDDEKFDAASAKKEASKALIKGVKLGDSQMVDDALTAHYEACAKETA